MRKSFGRVALAALVLVTACSPPQPAITSTTPDDGPPKISPKKPAPVQQQTAAKTASFVSKHTYGDGVQVQVTHIERSTLGAGARASTVKKGSPVQFLTVRVTNPTKKLVAAATSATMTYTKNGTAPLVADRRRSKPILGALLPGQAKTGTYGFAVPRKYLDQATLKLSIGSNRRPAVFSGSLNYSPGNSTVFNNPTGPASQQMAIIRHIERSIEVAPKNSTIRIAHYAFDINSTADKLIAAHKRGVHVQMLVDRHRRYAAMPWEDYHISSQTERLTKVLGSDTKKDSFVTMCNAACMSNRSSAMHAKFYTFSIVGSSQLVSMISSANITDTNSKGSWNNIHTVVGDARLYTSLRRYFYDMLKDKTDRDYYRTTTSGKYKLYLYPGPAKSVVLTDVLDNVTCTGAAAGYGKRGRTVIRVATYSWTSPRLDLAERLWRLHNKGCKVDVIYNSARASRVVTNTLLRKSAKYGTMPVFDGFVDRNWNDRPELYMHHKALVISGVWFGRPNTKVVYTGSQNFTGNATLDNNDIVFRIKDAATYDAYDRNLDYIQERAPRRWW